MSERIGRKAEREREREREGVLGSTFCQEVLEWRAKKYGNVDVLDLSIVMIYLY